MSHIQSSPRPVYSTSLNSTQIPSLHLHLHLPGPGLHQLSATSMPDHAKHLGTTLLWLSTSLGQNPSCSAWPAGPLCAPSPTHWAHSPDLYWLTPVTLSHSGTTSIEGRAPGPPLLPAERRKDETIENFIIVEYILTQKDIQNLLFMQSGKKGRLRNCLCKMIST